MYSVAPLTFLRNALRLYVMQTKIQGWESNRCFIMIVLSPWNFVWSITKFWLCAGYHIGFHIFDGIDTVLYQVSNQRKLYTTSIKIQTTTFSFIGWVCDGLYALKIYSAYPHMEVLCNLHHLLHDNLRIKIISRSII